MRIRTSLAARRVATRASKSAFVVNGMALGPSAPRSEIGDDQREAAGRRQRSVEGNGLRLTVSPVLAEAMYERAPALYVHNPILADAMFSVDGPLCLEVKIQARMCDLDDEHHVGAANVVYADTVREKKELRLGFIIVAQSEWPLRGHA